MKKLLILLIFCSFSVQADRGLVNLRWNSVAGATNYRVYFGPNSNRLPLVITNVGTRTNITLTNLTRRVMWFTITSINNANQESDSPIQSVVISGNVTNNQNRTRMLVNGTNRNVFSVYTTNQTLEIR